MLIHLLERKAEMKAKSGKTELPQIFINDKFIGVRPAPTVTTCVPSILAKRP